MEPASSSDDDSSTSTSGSDSDDSSVTNNNQGTKEWKTETKLHEAKQKQRDLTPVDEDSDSDSDDNDSDDSDSDDSNEESDGRNEYEDSYGAPKSMEDLPSEDSCLEDDSDDDNSDDDSDSDNDNPSNSTSNPYLQPIQSKQDEEEMMTLEERLYKRQQQGKYSDSIEDQNAKKASKVDAKERRKRALEVAQERLQAFKKKKLMKKAQHEKEDDVDDDENDSDGDDHIKKHSTNNGDSDSDSSKDSKPEEEPEATKPKKKKKNKNKPTEASSLRSAFYARGAPDLNASGIGVEIGANRYKPRDPRMSSLSGYYDPSVFEKRYGFLDEVVQTEIERLKTRCKAWKTTGSKGNKMRKKLGLSYSQSTQEQDEAELNRLLQEAATKKEDQRKRSAKSAVKKKIQDDVASGKRGVYYLKKRDMKRMELEAKFEELKKKGGDAAVNKVLAKRRKKMMSKDSGIMPKNF